MFAYYLRLAFKSLRDSPALSLLMAGAVALGIGVCITTLTVFYLMSANPIEHKSASLHAVTLDSWDPEQAYSDESPEQAPWELTFRDASALRASDIPMRHAAMLKSNFVLDTDREGVRPFQETARMTDRDFFALFDIPFLYGSAWDEEADSNGGQFVVLGRALNEKLFGGGDSTGSRLQMDGRFYTVSGVIDDWNPAPKYFDVNNGAFDDAEVLFAPFALVEQQELYSSGNTNCWKNEEINDYRSFVNSECVWVQYWAEFEDDAQKARYQGFLDDYVRSQKELGRFERPLNNRLTGVSEWLEVRGVVRDDNRVLLGLSFLFLAVCLFNTVGLLLAKFVGRAPRIALRRALGASRLDVFAQQLVEVGLVGVAGGVLGLLAAWAGLQGVAQLYPDYEQLVLLDGTMVAVAILISVAASVLAGLYPAWRICRQPPASYLRLQ